MSAFYQKKRWLDLKSKILDLPAYNKFIHHELSKKKFFHVLDCGTGTGQFVEVVREFINFTNLIGIDIDKDLIAEAKKKFNTYINIEFTTQNFYNLPNDRISENSFDLILGQAFLEHTSINHVIPILKNLCKSEAYLYFSHNYMSPTIFEPELSIDELIVNNFDEYSIENQIFEGHICGDRRCGAKLGTIFNDQCFEIIYYVGSNWLLYPKKGIYTVEEKEILKMIIDFFYNANKNRNIPKSKLIDNKSLDEWKIIRENQIEKNKLIYICPQTSILLKYTREQ